VGFEARIASALHFRQRWETQICESSIARCSVVWPCRGILVSIPRIQLLYDHLRNTLSTQCLAALELLPLEASKRIEDGSNQQKYSGNNQAGCLGPDADPLHCAHYKVDGGAHVVGSEFADEGIEFGRSRADAQEERDFDEDDDEREHSVGQISDLYRKVVRADAQADNAKRNDEGWMKDVRNAEREA
jgi:hypothetical protein